MFFKITGDKCYQIKDKSIAMKNIYCISNSFYLFFLNLIFPYSSDFILLPLYTLTVPYPIPPPWTSLPHSSPPHFHKDVTTTIAPSPYPTRPPWGILNRFFPLWAIVHLVKSVVSVDFCWTSTIDQVYSRIWEEMFNKTVSQLFPKRDLDNRQ